MPAVDTGLLPGARSSAWGVFLAFLKLGLTSCVIFPAMLAAGILLTEGGTLRLIRPLADPRFSEPDSGLYWQIEDDNNGAQLRSRSLWENVIGLPQDNIAPGAVHRHHQRVAGGGADIFTLERNGRRQNDVGVARGCRPG